MEKGIYVKDIQSGSEVAGFFVVSQASLGTASNGKPYWNLTLTDCTGDIDCKIWAPKSADFEDIPAGAVLDVRRATASVFRDRVQLSITDAAIAAEAATEALDRGWFMPTSPRPREDMLAELDAACGKDFSHGPWRTLLKAVFTDGTIRPAFCDCPAARSVHQAYIGGLLEHSLNVFRLCRHFADEYPELDRQTLLAAALLHDIGKIREYSWDMTIDVTTDGALLSHPAMGVLMLEPFIAASGLEEGLAQHLRHLILSHHGRQEYGAVTLPQTQEAFALNFADDMDAKMTVFRDQMLSLSDTAPFWSAKKIFPIDRRLFLPVHTPGPADGEAGAADEAGSFPRQAPFKDDASFEDDLAELALNDAAQAEDDARARALFDEYPDAFPPEPRFEDDAGKTKKDRPHAKHAAKKSAKKQNDGRLLSIFPVGRD